MTPDDPRRAAYVPDEVPLCMVHHPRHEGLAPGRRWGECYVCGRTTRFRGPPPDHVTPAWHGHLTLDQRVALDRVARARHGRWGTWEDVYHEARRTFGPEHYPTDRAGVQAVVHRAFEAVAEFRRRQAARAEEGRRKAQEIGCYDPDPEDIDYWSIFG